MKKHSNDFGNDSVPGLVLRTSIPFMFAQFVNVLYSIVDRIYIGNIPQIGDVSLAGAGICAPVITLLSSFATLIGIGGSVLFSMRLGAKDQEKAKNLLGTSFSMLLVFSAALTILFLLLKAPFLQWFGASKTTFPYANTYMTIYTLGTFFALLSMGMNYFITAQGYPGLGMATTLIGAVVNIVLDPVFIFLLHMNIAGAALATVLAQLSSCVFVLLTLKQKKMPIPLTLAPIRRSTAVRILKMGFSPFLILATDSVIIIALNAVLQHFGGPEYGDTLITCATIVQSYMLLITSPMLGITGGSQPLISFNMGAGRVGSHPQNCTLRPAFMHRFYDVYVPVVPFCSAVFCLDFHQKPGIRISFCLGHSGLYPRRYPPELPVCLCGCPDCHEPDKAVPVFIPAAEKRVFCSDLSASPLFRCKDVLLRGTHCRYALLLLFQSCLLPDL